MQGLVLIPAGNPLDPSGNGVIFYCLVWFIFACLFPAGKHHALEIPERAAHRS
jgi:hypothetical protein